MNPLARVGRHAYLSHMKRITPRTNAISDVYRSLGISRDELSRRMEVSTATAYRVEMGRTEPSPAFIAALMSVSGKKFEDLFEITDEVAAA